MDEKKFKTPWRNVPFEEMPNHKFGRLTAKRLVVDGIKRVRKWECECECGNVIVVLETTLIKGKKHCGCGNPLKRNWKELEGKKFNHLTALEFLGRKSVGRTVKPMFRCLCDCGNEVVVSASNLEYGISKSCGCGLYFKKKENTNSFEIKDGIVYGKTSDGVDFLLDEEDFSKIKEYSWCSLHGKYLVANIRGKSTRMHKLLLATKPKEHIDHINGNGFDNRKCNLRICSNAENSRNCMLSKNNTTGYSGVERAPRNRYSANIMLNRRSYCIGYYDSFKDAKITRIAAELMLFGDYAPCKGALKNLVTEEELNEAKNRLSDLRLQDIKVRCAREAGSAS